jgi:hypothetical protein
MILAVLGSKPFFLVKLTWRFRCKLMNICGQCHNSGGCSLTVNHTQLNAGEFLINEVTLARFCNLIPPYPESYHSNNSPYLFDCMYH